MGKSIYYIIVAVCIILGQLMPQDGPKKKRYVILMALLHFFVCGFRYQYLTGDLIKYSTGFHKYINYGWFSQQIFRGGRNFGFFMFQKLIAHLSGDNFQYSLITIAFITELAVAILVYRYSPKPWLSYLMWNCLGLFTFGFSAIKQALAMGFLMFSFVGIMEEKPLKFLLFLAIAGSIHQPAFLFAPAYWLAKRKVTPGMLVILVLFIVLVYIFRDRIVSFFAGLYYDEENEFGSISSVGGRFRMMVLLLLVGLVLKSMRDQSYSKLFMLMVFAAVIQMFAGYDNIFTRLADYYYQFAILYVPMIFYSDNGQQDPGTPLVRLHPRLRTLAIIAVVAFSIWFYQWSILSFSGASVDDYTNFRFMWEVTR